MKLYEIMAGPDSILPDAVGVVVELPNGQAAMHRTGEEFAWMRDSVQAVEASLPEGQWLERRHAPHAFRADRANYGEVRA